MITQAPRTVLTKEASEVRRIAGLPIRKSQEIMENNGVFITIYGSAGSGKTTLAASVAKVVDCTPMLYLDVEGGMAVVDSKDIDNGLIDPIGITSWAQIEAVRKALTVGDSPYKTIVIDNMSEVLTLCIRFVTGDLESPTQPEWGKITQNMLNMTRAWRDISKTTGLNVIFIAWDNPSQDESNVVKNNIYFTPALREQYPGIVDIVGHIGSQNGVRVLDFQWNPRKTQAKFRRSLNSNASKIPEKIPYSLSNMPLGDIISVLRGKSEWPSDKYQRPKPEESTSTAG